MKLKPLWKSLTLLTLLLSACTNGLNEESLNAEKHQVTFTSSIAVKQQTRAVDASWEANDQIGLFMFKAGSQNVLDANVRFETRTGNGNFNAVDKPLYYPENDESVDFIAYYPFVENASSVYNVDISSQKDPKRIDLMYANNLTNRNAASPKGSLQFYHQLARLTIQFSTTDNSDINSITATVKGVPTHADFNLMNGTLSVTDAKESVVMYRSGTVAQAILLPSNNVKDIRISVALADKVQEFALPADIKSLEPGTNYSFTVNVKNGATILIPDDSHASTWRETPALVQAELAKPNIHYISHFMPTDEKVRNYSLLYDSDLHISYWVAYPLCSYYLDYTKRTDAWDFDPQIDRSLQTDLTKSYGQGYVRGHQLPSADRTRNTATNKTTFYYTNITPQIHVGLNQDIWAKLEDKVRYWSKETDTLFVVTGASPTENLQDKNIKYIMKDNKQVAVPKFYYKALARKVNGQFRTIGFKLQHKAYSHMNFMEYVVPVTELEKATGFTFFPSLDVTIKESVDRNSWK